MAHVWKEKDKARSWEKMETQGGTHAVMVGKVGRSKMGAWVGVKESRTSRWLEGPGETGVRAEVGRGRVGWMVNVTGLQEIGFVGCVGGKGCAEWQGGLADVGEVLGPVEGI